MVLREQREGVLWAEGQAQRGIRALRRPPVVDDREADRRVGIVEHQRDKPTRRAILVAAQPVDVEAVDRNLIALGELDQLLERTNLTPGQAVLQDAGLELMARGHAF